jgi:uncharacterized protein YheU (UPF0270 family)
MKYQVTLSSNNNYNVTLPRVDRKKLVDVDTTPPGTDFGDVDLSVSELTDVDSSNKQDNYVLIWNATTQKHEYVPTSEVLDRADGIDDDSTSYGTY